MPGAREFDRTLSTATSSCGIPYGMERCFILEAFFFNLTGLICVIFKYLLLLIDVVIIIVLLATIVIVSFQVLATLQ